MHYPSFDVWLIELKKDAVRRGFDRSLENIPTRALELFFNDGLEASIDGLLLSKKPTGSTQSFYQQRRA